MYYATELFIKKGALGKIWLAGTLWKKLSRKQILESDICSLCKQVESPPIPLAISTSGKLTFGIVKIHEFQTGFVLKSANESYAKLIRFIKRVKTRNANINLSNAQICANMEQITIQQRIPIHDIGDIDLRDTTFLDLIHVPTQIAQDLIAPDEAITMQPHLLRDTAAMSRHRREVPRGLGLALDLDELGIDFELDLGIDDDELQEPEAQIAAIMDGDGDEGILPEPKGSSIDTQMPQNEPLPMPHLRDITASIEPIIPTIATPSMSPTSPPPIMPIPSIHSAQTSSPPLRPRQPPQPRPSAMSISVPTERRQIDFEEEEPTQRIATTPTRRRRTKKKKKRKGRFHRDDVIELADNERIINLNNTQDLNEFMVDRPYFSHIDDRKLAEGEFEELFTRSLSGIYADNALTESFREFTRMILEPSTEQRRRQRIEPQIPAIPLILGEEDEELKAIEPQISDVSLPSIEAVRAGPPGTPSIASSISAVDQDLFAGYRMDEILISSTPEISAMPAPKRRRLDELAEVTVSEESAFGIDMDSDRERRRGLKLKKRIMGKEKTSSEELSVPPELSKLTAFFKEILDAEMRKLETQEMDIDEDDIKVNLEQMLSFHAQQNGGKVSKRDVALGFMQTLILKNENIVEVEQEEWNGDILIYKGPRFYTQIPQ